MPKLEDVGSRDGDDVSSGELAEYLFEKTSVRTDQRLDYWIRNVLGMVLEWVAAQERLKCYRRFGADVPDNAEPAATREYDALLNRDARTTSKRTTAPEATCPECGTVSPCPGSATTALDHHRSTVALLTDSVRRLASTSCRGPKTVAVASATGHTGSMDTEVIEQERVQVVLARVREAWPSEAAEGWMYGSNDVLEDARPIDLVRLGRTDEVPAALEVSRA